jgi:hypothetical protein
VDLPIVFAIVLVVFVVVANAYWIRQGRRDLYGIGSTRPLPVALDDFLALTPDEFERVMGQFLRKEGYRDVRQVGGSGDLGVDLWCRDPKGRSTAVQCKRYAPGTNIGSTAIQTFIGMMNVHHAADQGIFITTTNYTKPARELADYHKIRLIDGNDLVQRSPTSVVEQRPRKPEQPRIIARKNTLRYRDCPTAASSAHESSRSPRQRFVGSGDTVSERFRLDRGVAVFHATCRGRDDIFIVTLRQMDGNAEYQIISRFLTRPYKGSRSERIEARGWYILDVEADSDWTVSIEQ